MQKNKIFVKFGVLVAGLQRFGFHVYWKNRKPCWPFQFEYLRKEALLQLHWDTCGTLKFPMCREGSPLCGGSATQGLQINPKAKYTSLILILHLCDFDVSGWFRFRQTQSRQDPHYSHSFLAHCFTLFSVKLLCSNVDQVSLKGAGNIQRLWPKAYPHSWPWYSRNCDEPATDLLIIVKYPALNAHLVPSLAPCLSHNPEPWLCSHLPCTLGPWSTFHTARSAVFLNLNRMPEYWILLYCRCWKSVITLILESCHEKLDLGIGQQVSCVKENEGIHPCTEE